MWRGRRGWRIGRCRWWRWREALLARYAFGLPWRARKHHADSLATRLVQLESQCRGRREHELGSPDPLWRLNRRVCKGEVNQCARLMQAQIHPRPETAGRALGDGEARAKSAAMWRRRRLPRQWTRRRAGTRWRHRKRRLKEGLGTRDVTWRRSRTTHAQAEGAGASEEQEGCHSAR